MEDRLIVELFWERSEKAISETADKYGPYCRSIAKNILGSPEDAEECVNDTWLRAWNSIPPRRPSVLRTFLGKITRNLSLDRYRLFTAEKRGSGQIPLALEELSECIPAAVSTERAVEEQEILTVLNCFLAELAPETRRIFVRRYWYLSPVKDIASAMGLGESKVKMTLLRTRKALQETLEKEGIAL